MSAKSFTIMTFGSIALIALLGLVFIFTGIDWQGGNEGVWLVFLIMSAIFFMGFLVYNQKWAPAKMMARQLPDSGENLSLEEKMNILQKHSYILLVASFISLLSGIFALIVY